jgi:hypothetical protein
MRGAALLLALVPAVAGAQNLEPRLYVPLPVAQNVIVASYQYSDGDVVIDATLPISDFTATLHAGVAAFARTFGAFGRSAQVQVVVPFVTGTTQGAVSGQDTSRALRGPADPQLRLAINLLGGPARRRQELAGVRFGTIVGVSMTVTAPFGEYDAARAVNIGANRWALKPEVGVVQPLARGWALEGYAGVSLFTGNGDFLDTATVTQEPLWAFQLHLIRIIGRRGFVALDGTVVSGGQTSVDGVVQNTFQRNGRIGLTAAWPLGRGHVLKAAVAKGVFTRVGGDFSIVSFGYQYAWGG